MFDKIAKSLPATSIAVILLGIYNMNRFYRLYDISIFQYVDASEILLSFADLVVIIILILTMHIVYGAVVFLVLRRYKLTSRDKRHDETVSDYLLKITKEWKVSLVLGKVIFAFAFISLTGFLIYISKHQLDANSQHASYTSFHFDFFWVLASVFISISFTFLMQSINALFIYSGNKLSFKLTNIYLYAGGSLIVLLLVFFEVRNRALYKYNMGGFPKYSVSLITKSDNKFFTNENLVYIISTRSYVFLKDKISSEVVIIPKSECKEIRLKKIIDGY